MENLSYKIGDTVYVKPNDWNEILKGKIVGFQKVGKLLPIIECNHPYKKNETFSNAFDLEMVSKTPVIKICEWKLVETIYKYKNENN